LCGKTTLEQQNGSLLQQIKGMQAQANLSEMYVQGQGVRHDSIEAVKWWKLAALPGNTNYTIAIENLPFLLDPQGTQPTPPVAPGTKSQLAGLNASAFNGKRGVVLEGKAALARATTRVARITVLMVGDANFQILLIAIPLWTFLLKIC
jgi:hypothetical protein